MRSSLLLLCIIFYAFNISAQNVGIGKNNPTQKLDVLDTINAAIARFNGGDRMYITLAEKGFDRGYIGSYAGNAQDVDFGTFDGNVNGSLHLTIQDEPKFTITPSGRVGIGITIPTKTLDVNGDAKINGDATITNDIIVNGIIKTDNKTNVVFTSGWVNYASGYEYVRYYKDKMDMVHITGLAESIPANANATIFTLPIGYRPAARLIFGTICHNNGTTGIARIDVSADGLVQIIFPGNTPVWLSLSGIVFKAE